MTHTDLQEYKNNSLTNEEVRHLLQKSQTGDMVARDILVEKNTRLVWSVVQRFAHRQYELDDLFQIGCIGLIKAIDKFDLSYDVRFSTYAVPMIIGEIQRFIRDDGVIKVSRSLKEMANKIRKEKEMLTKQLKRAPTVSEVAEALNVTKEEVAQAEEATKNPKSIYETVYDGGGDPIYLMDQIADEAGGEIDKIALQHAMEKLNKREKLIIYLRYFKDWTQSSVAERLNVSQVQVSRLEKKILQDMKKDMTEQK